MTILFSLANITPAKCHGSGIIVTHGLKTSILRLLTPLFQFVTPGRKVCATTAFTVVHFEIYINHIKKLEPMRE